MTPCPFRVPISVPAVKVHLNCRKGNALILILVDMCNRVSGFLDETQLLPGL